MCQRTTKSLPVERPSIYGWNGIRVLSLVSPRISPTPPCIWGSLRSGGRARPLETRNDAKASSLAEQPKDCADTHRYEVWACSNDEKSRRAEGEHTLVSTDDHSLNLTLTSPRNRGYDNRCSHVHTMTQREGSRARCSTPSLFHALIHPGCLSAPKWTLGSRGRLFDHFRHTPKTLPVLGSMKIPS